MYRLAFDGSGLRGPSDPRQVENRVPAFDDCRTHEERLGPFKKPNTSLRSLI